MKTEKSLAKTAKSSAKMPKLYIVVPCYNEEAVLPKTSRVLAENRRMFGQFDLYVLKERAKP